MKQLNGVLLFIAIIMLLGLMGLINGNAKTEEEKVVETEPEREFILDMPLTSSDEKFVYTSGDIASRVIKVNSEIVLKENVFLTSGKVAEISNEDEVIDRSPQSRYRYYSKCYISGLGINGVLKKGTRLKINQIVNPKPSATAYRKGAFSFLATTENGNQLQIEVVSVLWLYQNNMVGEYDPTMKDVEVFFKLPVLKGPASV